MKKHFLAAALIIHSLAATLEAELVMETVVVGNPGNAGELSGEGAGGSGEDRICGAVDYIYRIGKFEVTAGQYAQFLNAMAATTDTYGLYNLEMWSHGYGCKIRRTGSEGNYTYLVDPDADGVEDPAWANRPVTDVSWLDAARFCNWLHNGQPTGAQDLTTTEDGSYYLNGAMGADVNWVVRNPDATWVIPSEDEWYKAAYHYNDGATGNYYDYPTSSDTIPGYVNDAGHLSTTGQPFIEGVVDPGNYANYNGDDGTNGIGPPLYRTQVGEWERSASPYGTFDQGGNVWEWNEAVFYGSWRGLRGGSFEFTYRAGRLHAAARTMSYPQIEDVNMGFRVAKVYAEAPIPAVSEWGMVVLILVVSTAGTLALLRRRLPA